MKSDVFKESYRKGRKRKRRDESLMLPQSGAAPDSLRATMAGYLESLAVRNYSEATRAARSAGLLRFARWCEERGLLRPAEVTRLLLERYQRHLFYARKPNGHPLSARSQHAMLSALCTYFRWATRQNLLPLNPASELLLPRIGHQLPRDVLSAQQVEKVLAQANVETLEGLRDRAVLEVLWATGLRRRELGRLSVFDINHELGTVFVRYGKGNRDRVVPIGARALQWVRRYIDEVRPRLVLPPDEGVLFLSNAGLPMSLDVLTQTVAGYVKSAGVAGKGGCHLFRHACATQMLEGGADIRFVQELLGHASLETTQVYTRVAISKLKAVYEATHPAAKSVAAAAAEPRAPVSQAELLEQLAADDD